MIKREIKIICIGIIIGLILFICGGLYCYNALSNMIKMNRSFTIIESDMEGIKLKRKVDAWELKLANKENTISKDYEIPLAVYEEGILFDERAIERLKELLQAAEDEGYTNLWVQSAYRDQDLQKKLFDEQVDEYKRQGKTEEEAEQLATTIISKPGQSDHNLGLGVDFNYVNNDFEKLPVYKWLCENASKYGFILRFPKEKEHITGVKFEPWHWRYVGIENAQRIKQKDMCLEEYVTFLEHNDWPVAK